MPNRATRSESRYAEQAGQLAEIVRKARQDQRISQQELATRAGISVGAVRALESKRTVEPGYFTVQVLANVLKIPAADLPVVPPVDQP